MDMSLETAEEVERMEAIERAMREDRLRHRSDGETAQLPQGAEGEVEGQRENSQGNKAFDDITDLENEDFVFIF